MQYSEIIKNLRSIDEAQHELIRVFHGRGHCYPDLNHLNLDYYPPYLFLVSYKQLSDEDIADLSQQIWDAASAHFKVNLKGLVFQHRNGLKTVSTTLYGEDPGRFNVTELGLSYQVQLTRTQNTGIFPDMKPGRHFIKASSAGKKVLNLFSYTCAFSVAAKAGGADLVVNMDMNKGVLKTGKINHALNELEDNVRFFSHDVLASFGKMKKFGPFDLVIVDPPSFQKGSFDLIKDYKKILRRLTEFAGPGCKLLLCANSPDLTEHAFKQLIAEYCPYAQFEYRLPASDNFTEANPDRSLKALVYSLIEASV